MDVLLSKTNFLFRNFRNCKRRNKGNFTLKFNSNKMMLCWGGGQHYVCIKRYDSMYVTHCRLGHDSYLQYIFWTQIWFGECT